MRSRLGIPAVLAVAAVVVTTAASPASAAIARTGDPVDRGVPAYSDLTRLRVRNGEHLLEIDLKLRALRPDKTSAYATLGSVRAPGSYTVGTQSSGHGHRPVLVEFGVEGDDLPVQCRGLEVRLDRTHDKVHITVPRRCLGGLSDRIRVAGLTEEPGDGADVDDTRAVTVGRG